ncbi:hypothetical protein R3W88_001242 [Solanum pinnatisectum]|uniref:Integrase core domain containing protein n=1 Tax=Solanum pinnatisectum TaxID=50273 RepID=A0AAV9MHN5_9SOLN|nr:hypothetical protein R3W88_001242 [Solanum pinnatisectum]
MGHMMDLKVQAVNKRLDAFQLRVLERPVPTTYISYFWTKLDSLQANLDVILALPMDMPESAPTAPVDDTVLDALYNEDTPQSESTHAQGKRHRSSHTSDATEDARAKKREPHQTTQARRVITVDEELRQ